MTNTEENVATVRSQADVDPEPTLASPYTTPATPGGEDPTAVLTADFSETARILFSAGSVTNTLNRVIELAVAGIEGCDHAGIFILRGAQVTTPVRSDPLVVTIDNLQQSLGEGPCLDAVSGGGVLYAADLDHDPRWPAFGPLATEAGIRSLLALQLCVDGTVGALNLYARYPTAFGVIDRAKALLLAVLAGQALRAAQVHADEEGRLDNLQQALVTREVIGQAEGILMERERISADQAFDILRRASQNLNIKLRDIAQTLVDTGEDPKVGKPGRRAGPKPSS